jgi:8-oxo-(d)GTP phosphatase
MTVFLVRHAQAGNRAEFHDANDRLRPLTDEGRHQSAALVGTLADLGVKAIYSSPFRRCVQTAAPLAAHLDLPVIQTEALAEGPSDDAYALTRSPATQSAALFSHGDIIPGVLQSIVFADALFLGTNPRCQKASIWMLETAEAPAEGGAGTSAVFVRATYIAPPR